MAYWKRSACAAFVFSAGVSTASADQLNAQQIQIIKDTAASICNTVKDARGQKSDIQIQGEVKAQLGGLVGKVVDVGGSGKGSLTREEFEGLSRDATASALQGDRDCRERLFNKMFDKLSAGPSSSGQSAAPRRFVQICGKADLTPPRRTGAADCVPTDFLPYTYYSVSDGNPRNISGWYKANSCTTFDFSANASAIYIAAYQNPGCVKAFYHPEVLDQLGMIVETIKMPVCAMPPTDASSGGEFSRLDSFKVDGESMTCGYAMPFVKFYKYDIGRDASGFRVNFVAN